MQGLEIEMLCHIYFLNQNLFPLVVSMSGSASLSLANPLPSPEGHNLSLWRLARFCPFSDLTTGAILIQALITSCLDFVAIPIFMVF